MSEDANQVNDDDDETEVALSIPEPEVDTEQAITDVSLQDGKMIKQEAEDTDVIKEYAKEGITEEELNVIGFDSSIPPGQHHYIIVSRDGETVEQDVQVEPPVKKLRTDDGEGQFFVLTVKDGSEGTLTPGFDFDPTQVVAKASNTVRMATVPPKKGISDSDVSQAWFTTRDDKVMLQSKGASWKQGQWTKDEVEVLQNNIQNYCKVLQNSNRAQMLISQSQNYAILRNCLHLSDEYKHSGQLTCPSCTPLRTLRHRYFSDAWDDVRSVTGRSRVRGGDKPKSLKSHLADQFWLKWKRLYLSELQKRVKWTSMQRNLTVGDLVLLKEENTPRNLWPLALLLKSRKEETTMLDLISHLDVNNETEIDWEKLATDWPSVRSPQWLRGKWWSMKRHVPDYQHRPFSSLVYYLKQMALQNVHIKNPVNGSMPLTRVDLPQTNTTDMTLHIPVTLQPANQVEGIDEDGTLQAYEVLQHLTPTSSGTYLITQPHSNPAISLSGSLSGTNMATDHIIVHTVPLNQVRSNENVAVQLNHQPHVIISSATGSTGVETVTSLEEAGITSAIELTDASTSSEQVLHSLTQVDPETSASDNDIQQTVITTVHEYDPQDITEASITSESEIVCSTAEVSDMVLVTSTSPNLLQSGSTDGEFMSSLSDPMLTSETTDLIGSCSDVEGEKGHVNENETEHDLNDITDT
ncbi:hypothetical protein ScPMuIL_009600 [Solemya velum]